MTRFSAVVAALAVVAAAAPVRAEVILQYFEMPGAEIEARMPEVAAASALWLPPPTKGTACSRDVGAAPYDRFELGDVNQRGQRPRATAAKTSWCRWSSPRTASASASISTSS